MGAKIDTMVRAALTADDRPIVGVVGMDAAGETGTCGLCVVRLDGVGREWMAGPPVDARTFRWLGERVARLCAPGTRVVMVAEKDAFGPSVGRKLGIGIGAIQGLLLDLNAIAPLSRVDIASVTWRGPSGIPRGLGRAASKAAAIQVALPFTGVPVAADAAEAILIAEWGRRAIAKAAKYAEARAPRTRTGALVR